MSSSDLPPLQRGPVPQSETGAPPPDPGFTFRIARVQEWTLGTLLAAAVGFGVWMGTLTTKLEHIEKFVDAANDGSTGVFTRLATIQTTLDLVDKSNSQQSGKVEKASAVEFRFVPLTPSSGPTQPQTSSLDTFVEYTLIREILEGDRKASESGRIGDASKIEGKQPKAFADAPRDPSANSSVAQNESTPPQAHDTSSSDSDRTKAEWLDNLKQTALADLQRLKADVNANKKMHEPTKTELLSLITAQEQRINAMKK